MRRNHWVIILSLLILLVAGCSLMVLIFGMPKASAPSAIKKETNGNNLNSNATIPLTLYYIAIDDNGKSGSQIGCGDSAVAVTTDDVTTSDVIKSTFEALLKNHNQYYGQSGLYNVLYNSNLVFVSSSKSGDSVTVNLTGNLSLAGECDNPRVQAELEMAAKKAANVNVANIFINSKPLSEVLSLK